METAMSMRWTVLGVAVSALLLQGGASAADPLSYVIEPPDVLKIEVTGLPKGGRPVSGKYLVQPDGTVSLGGYGHVLVSNLTLGRARAAIARHLAQHAKGKGGVRAHVELAAQNSKFYYVIFPGENGRQVRRFPSTENDTAVGAVLQVEGLARVAAKGTVRVERAAADTLEVNWRAITRRGRLATNHKLRPGDRVYVGVAPPG
jgi:protein involved in polysaccharide export with SLBB domain